MFNEEIKGWKNAGRDIQKMRSKAAADARPVKMVQLKKNGEESKLRDHTTKHDSVEDAVRYRTRLVNNNPGMSFKHNLYIDGKLVKTLSEDAPTVAIGGGAIEGAGVGPKGEPGMTPKAIAKYKNKNKQKAPRKIMGFADFTKG